MAAVIRGSKVQGNRERALRTVIYRESASKKRRDRWMHFSLYSHEISVDISGLEDVTFYARVEIFSLQVYK